MAHCSGAVDFGMIGGGRTLAGIVVVVGSGSHCDCQKTWILICWESFEVRAKLVDRPKIRQIAIRLSVYW